MTITLMVTNLEDLTASHFNADGQEASLVATILLVILKAKPFFLSILLGSSLMAILLTESLVATTDSSIHAFGSVFGCLDQFWQRI